MQPRHHPAEDALLDFASGALDEPTAVLVASHLTYCTHCRAVTAEIEAAAAALMEELTGLVPHAGPASLETLLARLESEQGADEDAPTSRISCEVTLLPDPIRRLLGPSTTIPWRRRGGGIESTDPLVTCGAVEARLIRVRSGRGVPTHTHAGREMTLVLDGAFDDIVGRVGCGDVMCADESVTHRPVASADGDCTCLSVIEGERRYKGPFGPLIGWLASR